MALSNAIPEVVSSVLLEALHASLVYEHLFNQDYEGEIKSKGDILKIPSIGAVVTEAYTRYTDLTGQTAADSSVDLEIDKQRAFSITLDDIDAVQAVPSVLSAYLREATFQLQKDIDSDLAAELIASGTLATDMGTTTTPIEVNSSNICTQLRAMAVLLDETLVPRDKRAIVLPPWAVEKLTLASIVSATDNTEPMANGIVGRYAGFDIYMSPLVVNTSGAAYRILAGSPISATYGIQVNKVETIRHPKQFADVLRGLVVYGAKATRPTTIINAVWNKADEA